MRDSQQNSQNLAKLCHLCAKKGTGLKKVHHPRWWLWWQISTMAGGGPSCFKSVEKVEQGWTLYLTTLSGLETAKRRMFSLGPSYQIGRVYNWNWTMYVSNYLSLSSSQAGLRADGAGESALPAEESPWRLRALSRERELWEFYKKIASISSWEREKKLTLLAVVLILWPLPEWPPAPGETFPLLSVGAVRWARGGPCVALLPYHSTWAREKGDRWPGERHHTSCSGLLHAVPPDPNLARGGARWEKRESRGRRTRDLLGNSDHPWSEVYGVCVGVDRSGIPPIKISSLTLGVVCQSTFPS